MSPDSTHSTHPLVRPTRAHMTTHTDGACFPCCEAEIPEVLVKRLVPNSTFPGKFLTFIDCPFCGKEHMHGDGPGHRLAHCAGVPDGRGYVLVYPPSRAGEDT